MKIERYTKVDIGDGVIVFIRNTPYKVYSISDGGKIFCADTETYDDKNKVTLYKQTIDEKGDPLENPIYGDDNYYFEYPDGTRVKCSND